MTKETGKETQAQERKETGVGHAVARRESPQLAANPFTVMRRFMDDLDRLFGFGFGPRGELGGTSRSATDMAWMPPLEVAERNGQLVIRADVPGLTKDQITVEVEEGQLVISGERRQEHEERHGGVYRSERSYGRFYRSVPLPEGADADKIKATFLNGVLEITMPLTERPHHARRVEVQEGSATQPTHH